MPTLTFQSPEDAAYAVVNKKTGYSVWDNQEKVISEDLNLKKWAQLEDD